jgi:hypothetical protein
MDYTDIEAKVSDRLLLDERKRLEEWFVDCPDGPGLTPREVELLFASTAAEYLNTPAVMSGATTEQIGARILVAYDPDTFGPAWRSRAKFVDG